MCRKKEVREAGGSLGVKPFAEIRGRNNTDTIHAAT